MESTNSKLLTLVFTDLVDSTRLKSLQGDSRAGSLIARHRDHVTNFCAECDGRVVDWAGDGCFMTFETPSAAVRFALDLQQFHGENSDLPKVRTGIHVGEVTERSISRDKSDRADVEGLAVDIAARIQSLALPGQILVSGVVFDSARQRLLGVSDDQKIAWIALGSYVFKGFDEPVAIGEIGIDGIAPLQIPEDAEKAKRAVAPTDEDTLGWRPAAGLNVPQRERWVLQEQLGKGGYGEVWLAQNRASKRKQVFKFCFEPERLRGLRREVTMFRLMQDSLGERDDISKVLDWEFETAPFFLEMEYIEGGDLLDWSEQKGGLDQVPLKTRLEIVAQVADAIAAAHSLGILHKDVKPANTLMRHSNDGKPRACLTDFGIGLITDPTALNAKGITAAGFTETIEEASATYSTSGTRLYTSPEVLEGKSVTTSADIYSLGVMLYQIVIGDFGRAMAAGWEAEVDDETLREDIALCVEGRPERRLKSASELAERLRGLDERTKKLEVRRDRLAREEGARRRRKIAGILSIIGPLVIVIAGIFAFQENARRVVAEDALERVDEALDFAEYQVYNGNIQLANIRVQTGRIPLAGRYLEDAPAQFRNWEWMHLVNEVWPDLDNTMSADSVSASSSDTSADLWASGNPGIYHSFEAHPGTISSTVFSDDDKWVSTGSASDSAGAVWNVQTGELNGRFVSERGSTVSAVLSNDNTTLLTGGWEGHVILWDVKSGESKTNFSQPATDSQVQHVWLNDDGSVALSAHIDGSITFWNPQTGIPIRWIDRNEDVVIVAAHWLDEGRQLLTADYGGKVQLWRSSDGMEMQNSNAPVEGTVAFMDIHSDGTKILTGVKEGRIILWEWESQTIVREFTDAHAIEHTSERYNIGKISDDGSCVATLPGDNSLHLWSVETGARIATRSAPVESFTCAAFSHKGDRIVAAGANGSIYLWAPSVMRGQFLNRTIDAHDDVAFKLAYTPDSHYLVSGSFDHTARVWDARSGDLVTTLTGTESEVYNIAVSADGKRVGAWFYDGVQQIWDWQENSTIFEFVPKEDPGKLTIGALGGLRGFAMFNSSGNFRSMMSYDGSQMALYDGKNVSLHDMMSGKPPIDIEPYDDDFRPTSPIFSPDGVHMATTHPFKNFVPIWNTSTGKRSTTLQGHNAAVTMGSYNSTGSKLVTASFDATVRTWDAISGDQDLVLTGHKGIIFMAGYSHDDRMIVSGGDDNIVRVWDAQSGELLQAFEGHSAQIVAVYFSPDDSRILSVAGTNEFKVWDLQGVEVFSFNGGPELLHVIWSPDGRQIAAAGVDGKIKIFYGATAQDLELFPEDSSVPFGDRLAWWRSSHQE